MRRKLDGLVPFEVELIEAAKKLREYGIPEFYGFQISQHIEDTRLGRFSRPSALQKLRAIVGYGTLYRALGRLQKMGMLQSRWEELPPGENRPRRRYYKLTENMPKKGDNGNKRD